MSILTENGEISSAVILFMKAYYFLWKKRNGNEQFLTRKSSSSNFWKCKMESHLRNRARLLKGNQYLHVNNPHFYRVLGQIYFNWWCVEVGLAIYFNWWNVSCVPTWAQWNNLSVIVYIGRINRNKFILHSLQSTLADKLGKFSNFQKYMKLKLFWWKGERISLQTTKKVCRTVCRNLTFV